MRKALIGPLAAAAGSLSISLLCFYLLHSNATIAALFLLLGVMLAGTYASRLEAIAAAVAATLCLDFYFIPPIFKISIGDPQGWIALAVFLAVSLIAKTWRPGYADSAMKWPRVNRIQRSCMR